MSNKYGKYFGNSPKIQTNGNILYINLENISNKLRRIVIKTIIENKNNNTILTQPKL